MNTRPESSQEPAEPNMQERLMADAGHHYQQINKRLTIQSDDPLWLAAVKLIGRFLVIAFLILCSPLILFGLAFAFAAVF